jgi:hypothetical protein
MSQPLVYIDTSEVRDGALEELRVAIRELAEFVEENEPQLVSYDVYFSDDGTQMTVIHVHTDPASLDDHMDVAGPRFGRFADLVKLRSTHIYGASRARRQSASCATRYASLETERSPSTRRTPGSGGLPCPLGPPQSVDAEQQSSAQAGVAGPAFRAMGGLRWERRGSHRGAKAEPGWV